MQTHSIPKFIISVVLFIFSSLSSAQEKTASFDYTKTVWIINVIGGSGVVYGRPRSEDYNARNGFIYIYEILDKYVYSLQDINTSTGSLTATHELNLINGTTEQRILLGDHFGLVTKQK